MRIKGVDYIRVSRGDAADTSWEVNRIRGMSLSPVVRESGEDSYAIYLTPDEAIIYDTENRKEEEIYWHSPEGIEEEKRIGQEILETQGRRISSLKN